MFTSTVDLGQILLGCLLGIIGYFIKRELSMIHKRLDKHDNIILNLFGSVNRLIGASKGLEVINMDDK